MQLMLKSSCGGNYASLDYPIASAASIQLEDTLSISHVRQQGSLLSWTVDNMPFGPMLTRSEAKK
jgi:hypothetical protein